VISREVFDTRKQLKSITEKTLYIRRKENTRINARQSTLFTLLLSLAVSSLLSFSALLRVLKVLLT